MCEKERDSCANNLNMKNFFKNPKFIWQYRVYQYMVNQKQQLETSTKTMIMKIQQKLIRIQKKLKISTGEFVEEPDGEIPQISPVHIEQKPVDWVNHLYKKKIERHTNI